LSTTRRAKPFSLKTVVLGDRRESKDLLFGIYFRVAHDTLGTPTSGLV